MNIKEEVKDIIKKRWEGLKNQEDLISLYNIEKQTNQGYNGRQLLELFQNCEDEGATEVRIFLDTKNCLLKISNNGKKAFSVKGYTSIFYPGFSSKVSSGYIGNKGLGFRSIINWSNKISIISNGFKVVFDESLKKDILINEIGYTEADLNLIRKERKLTAEVCPIPLLNSCKVVDLETQHDFTTTISINYKKEFESDILDQLESINVKTLLFLQNINTIEIDGNGDNNKVISITRKEIDDNNFEINYEGGIYYVLVDEGIIDEDLIDDKESIEVKQYSVKIAYNSDLSFKDDVLYNYFKTQIPFELPFVVHASLELDQNRNHGTESKVNPFVLNRLFQLHLKLIETLKNKGGKSWLPYQLIDKGSNSIHTPYSSLMDDYWGKFEVFPTLSGKYENIKQVESLGNEIAKFIEDNQLEKDYGKQIIFCDLTVNPQQIKMPCDYVEKIEKIGEGLNIKQRAQYVTLILEHYPNEKFSLLIDDKEALITSNNYVYTDKTADNKNLEVPSYSKIRFLHPELYQALISELSLQSEKNKSRALKDKLDKISEVYSFEPLTVVKKIISETNEYLNSGTIDENEIIEFYQKLFHNYNLRDEGRILDYDAVIPCLNQLEEIIDIKELVLSEEFKIGIFSNQIFGKLYSSDSILVGLEKLGLEQKNLNEVEAFLKWLGINHMAIIEKKTSGVNGEFILHSNKNQANTVNFKPVSNYNYSLFFIKNFDEILNRKSTTINHIIGWFLLDEKLKNIFTNYSLTYSSKEELSYFYRRKKNIDSFENYIYFRVTLHFQVKNYLITNKREEWFNPFKVDYDFLSNISKKLDKKEVDRILSFFGAKKDFNDLDITYLKEKTQELAARNKYKGAQVFYRNLVGHFKKHEAQMLDVNLYARKGGEVVAKNASEIYFSDRIQLPEALTNRFPLLYYPSRSGGSRAIEMFGLKNLNKLNLKIIEVERNTQIECAFEKYIKGIKPFVLAFRLDKITKEEVRKVQVQQLNKVKIICCNKLVCRIEDEEFKIEPLNYVYSENSFYINIPTGTTIADLQGKKKFIDNLSDVFLKQFDTLDEKKIFESILRQSSEDNIYDVNNELAEGILEEAKILLGEVSIRLSIWKSIFKLKEKIEDVSILNENNLDEQIKRNFPNMETVELFNSDDNLVEINRIREVFKFLSLELEDYNSNSDYKLTFDKLYEQELRDFYDKRKKDLKNQLWKYLAEKGKEKQSDFLKYLNQIEHLLDTVILSDNASNYDFSKIILAELKRTFPELPFILENYNCTKSYDSVESKNAESFSIDELITIRKDEKLNSLSYFEGQIDFIKSEIEKREKEGIKEYGGDFKINLGQPVVLIEGAEIEWSSNGKEGNINKGLWLGGTNELTSKQKKKLGTSVEEVVKKYLESYPKKYKDVEHIAKTNEGAHYDIKYYDILQEKIKYVECKYYNGSSFLLSREEKKFADQNSSQYEIWLVTKELKIYHIENIKELDEKLQVVGYKVVVKFKNNKRSK